MTTSPLIGSSSSSSSSSASNSAATTAGNLALTPQDFIKMMVTQLQNQDPLQPTNNSELLSQMSQIGQLQSATDLQTSLKSMVLQNQVASAGNLIGKSVTGVDDNQNPVSGVVQSVSVTSTAVTLNLDNHQSLSLSNITTINGTATASTPTTTGTTTTSHT